MQAAVRGTEALAARQLSTEGHCMFSHSLGGCAKILGTSAGKVVPREHALRHRVRSAPLYRDRLLEGPGADGVRFPSASGDSLSSASYRHLIGISSASHQTLIGIPWTFLAASHRHVIGMASASHSHVGSVGSAMYRHLRGSASAFQLRINRSNIA